MPSIRFVAMAAFALVLGGIAAPAVAQDAAWDQLAAAAKKEGKLVFYTSARRVVPRAMIRLFEEKYGIQVDAVEGTPAQMRERVRAERSSGRAIGDVRMSGITSGVPEAAEGHYQPHGGLPNSKLLRAPFADDGTIVPVTIERWIMLINSTLVPPADEPKSWRDLTDPKWKGKIGSNDPRAPSGAVGMYGVLLDKLGPGFIEGVKANQPVFEKDNILGERRTAQGEFSIYVPLVMADMEMLQGLPVKPIAPAEGSPYITTVAAMMKDAPHPNAARLFLNFLMSPEAQEQNVKLASEAVIGIPADKVPAEMKAIMATPLMGTPDPATFDDTIKTIGNMFR